MMRKPTEDNLVGFFGFRLSRHLTRHLGRSSGEIRFFWGQQFP
jgi:hypothetical protein